MPSKKTEGRKWAFVTVRIHSNYFSQAWAPTRPSTQKITRSLRLTRQPDLTDTNIRFTLISKTKGGGSILSSNLISYHHGRRSYDAYLVFCSNPTSWQVTTSINRSKKSSPRGKTSLQLARLQDGRRLWLSARQRLNCSLDTRRKPQRPRQHEHLQTTNSTSSTKWRNDVDT